MKKYIEIRELYPVYFLDGIDGFDPECDLPEELIDRNNRLLKEFQEVQAEIEIIYNKANKISRKN